MRLLLVDDEEQVIKAMLRVLRRRPGVVPVGVPGIDEAREQLSRGSFDAVVVDHHLAEGASGVELLREVAARWPSVRRVLCSGGDLPGDSPVDDVGVVQAVLEKPATADELLAAAEVPAADAAAPSRRAVA